VLAAFWFLACSSAGPVSCGRAPTSPSLPPAKSELNRPVQ
jgi:hypothetical protein